MNRNGELANLFIGGCAILPVPLLLTLGPVAAVGAMLPLLALGCYFGGREQVETGEGPLVDEGRPQPQRGLRR